MSSSAPNHPTRPAGWDLKRYRALIENLPLGIFETTRAGDVLYCNPYMLQMLDIPLDSTPAERSPAKGRTFAPEDRRKFWDRLEAEGELLGYEVIFYRLDGTPLDVLVNARLKPGVDGAPPTCEGTVEDISARRQAERAYAMASENLRRVTQVKNEFLANISHELLTPMNGMQGMLELLMDTPLDTEQADYLRDARECGDKLLNLLHQILAYNQAEAGTLVLDPVNFSPAGMLAEVAAVFRTRAAHKGLVLHMHVTPELPLEVCAPSPVIRRILAALVDNAVKFTARGAVSLNMHGANGRLYFTVRDTGIGMTREQIDWVLQPFAQVDSGPARRNTGIGLGLLLAKRLAQSLGGQFAISSEPGTGTTIAFSTLLPNSGTGRVGR
jgi:signal transduction histidine kinase